MTRSFRTLAAAGAMALVLSACGVNQSEPPVVTAPPAPMTACERSAKDLQKLVEAIPGVRLHEVLTGRVMRLFMEAYNATPPESNLSAEQVVVLTHPEKPTHFFILVSGGCVVASGEVAKNDYEKMKRGVSI